MIIQNQARSAIIFQGFVALTLRGGEQELMHATLLGDSRLFLRPGISSKFGLGWLIYHSALSES